MCHYTLPPHRCTALLTPAPFSHGLWQVHHYGVQCGTVYGASSNATPVKVRRDEPPNLHSQGPGVFGVASYQAGEKQKGAVFPVTAQACPGGDGEIRVKSSSRTMEVDDAVRTGFYFTELHGPRLGGVLRDLDHHLTSPVSRDDNTFVTEINHYTDKHGGPSVGAIEMDRSACLCVVIGFLELENTITQLLH